MSAAKREIRALFRKVVHERDRWRCRLCGRNDRPLDAHHITAREYMPAGGYVLENGITLCDPSDVVGCHMLVERGVSFIAGDRPGQIEDIRERVLYARIGSSYGDALDASHELAVRLGLNPSTDEWMRGVDAE